MAVQWDNILKQIRFAFARPLHPRGIAWVGVPLLLLVLSIVAGWHGANFWLFITIVFYVCFRDPARVPPAVDGIGVSPADGILTAVDRAPWPIEVEQAGETQRIIISPRFYDVHVLRAPVASALTYAQQFSGQWGSNIFDKSSAGLERTVAIFKLPNGQSIAIEVVGGAMADRVRLNARSGDVVTVGQAIAYAAFGGEVRLYVPESVTVISQIGQRMIAGETPLVALQS